MGEEVREFALHWNNFTENIVNSFQVLHKQQDLCDVTLAVEGKLLKAHKIVLSICSPYFQEMFNSTAPSQPLFFVLHNMSVKLVTNLLEFMYLGSVNVEQSELQAFMKIAESLKVKGLTSRSTNNNSPIEDKENHSKQSSGHKRHIEDEETNEDDKNIENIIEITDLSNDDDQDNEINDESMQYPIPEVSMHESRMINNEKTHNNLKITSVTGMSNFDCFSSDSSSKKPSFFAENPCDSSGSNVTMLSSTSLLHGNCIFNRNNTVATQAGLKTYWLCKSYRNTMCKARCITHQGKVISATGIHNHLPHISNKPSEIPLGHAANNLVYGSSPPNQQQQPPQIPEINQVFINNPTVTTLVQQTPQQSLNFMPQYMAQLQPGMSLNNSTAELSFSGEFNMHSNNVKLEQI